jgi:succinate dehydrogenase / fumarate reductase cytochrome b subunit
VRSRPVFLHFARIRFPVGALASIGHRISGIVLAAALPLGAVLLERSLRSDAGAVEAFESPAGRIGLVLLAWAAAHHVFAGVRHLLMDVGIGAGLDASRRSAHAAIVSALAVAAAAAMLALQP